MLLFVFVVVESNTVDDCVFVLTDVSGVVVVVVESVVVFVVVSLSLRRSLCRCRCVVICNKAY